MASGQALKTGIVAIGRNEGDRLVRCLSSLKLTKCPIVYVDSASSDGSQERARQLGAKVIALDLSRPFTAARARQEGVEALAADHSLEYVFFLDGDCEVEAGFLATAVAFLDTHPEFAAACGRRRERFPEATPYNGLIDREWATPVGEAEGCGGDALYRLAVYLNVGGFNPDMLAGEEPELCSRLRAAGWRIMRLDIPMTIHDAAMTRFGQWWQRGIRSGMGYIQAWLRTRTAVTSLYAAEIRRAVLWAGILPAAIILLALAVHPALFLLWPGVLILQFLRLARRQGRMAAALSIVGKYAELTGIARYGWRALVGRTGSTVNYK